VEAHITVEKGLGGSESEKFEEVYYGVGSLVS